MAGHSKERLEKSDGKKSNSSVAQGKRKDLQFIDEESALPLASVIPSAPPIVPVGMSGDAIPRSIVSF